MSAQMKMNERFTDEEHYFSVLVLVDGVDVSEVGRQLFPDARDLVRVSGVEPILPDPP